MRTSGDTKGPAVQARLADFSTIGWLSLIDPVHDTISGTRRGDTLSAQAGGDIVLGLAGNDDLSSAFNRTALVGGKGNDKLTTEVVVPVSGSGPVHGLAIQIGDAGNDTLAATVTLQGGDIRERDAIAEVLLDGGSGNDHIDAVANVALPTFGNVIVTTHVLGGSGADVIHAVADTRGAGGSDNFAMNFVDGGSGADHIMAQAETELVASHATAINVLYGGDGNDVLDASARGRSISTELVSNSLYGGSGNDMLRAFNLTNSDFGAPVGTNELWGDDGKDVLEATCSAVGNGLTDVTNFLNGGKGDDTLVADITGNGGRVRALNQLEGGDGKDTLTAHLDVAAIGGGPAIPSYDVANVLNGGSGNDRLEAFLSIAPRFSDGSRAENRLDGGSGNDILVATVAPDSGPASSILNGGAGKDQLTVFGGSDNILNGGDGNDILTGGIGNDHLNGQGGADRFVFGLQNGHDTVDFQKGQDVIDLRALAATIGSFADLAIERVGANSVIHFDPDNDVTVLGTTNLSANDFWFA